ncbi:hypothetical protein LX36DRAFT_752144 [Colletotrichum falcatum]|nr:hypothetical protein LX36DRAFT_752144 [Colletotrichum falcatum]
MGVHTASYHRHRSCAHIPSGQDERSRTTQIFHRCSGTRFLPNPNGFFRTRTRLSATTVVGVALEEPTPEREPLDPGQPSISEGRRAGAVFYRTPGARLLLLPPAPGRPCGSEQRRDTQQCRPGLLGSSAGTRPSAIGGHYNVAGLFFSPSRRRVFSFYNGRSGLPSTNAQLTVRPEGLRFVPTLPRSTPPRYAHTSVLKTRLEVFLPPPGPCWTTTFRLVRPSYNCAIPDGTNATAFHCLWQCHDCH